MAIIARQKLGMTLDDFYDCTWYDWGLWTERIVELALQRRQDQELLMEMFRTSWTRYFNWNRGDNPAVSPEDFLSLSYDKPRTDTVATPEDKMKIVRDLEEQVKQRRLRRG